MELIRMPPMIPAGRPEEAVQAMQRYLRQFAQQVQFALEESRGIEKRLQERETAGNTLAEKSTPAATFGRIKDLIIKSADIVEAYRTEITRTLAGQFVAVSEFGTFKEQTTAVITETDKNMTQHYQMMQQITTDVTVLENSIIQMNAYIRTGQLYEQSDGTVRYGVEIGEQVEKDGAQVFSKFARLTSDRLSFFDQNGIEVAYVSDRKLYITAAEIQEIRAKKAAIQSLALGDYLLQVGNDGHLTIS